MGPPPHMWIFKITSNDYAGVTWIGKPVNEFNIGCGDYWLHMPLQAVFVITFVVLAILCALFIRALRKKNVKT